MMKTCICDRLRGRDGKEKEPFGSTSVDSRHGRLDSRFSANQVSPIGLSPHFRSARRRETRRAEFPGGMGDVRGSRFTKRCHAAAFLDVCCCESASTWAFRQHHTDFSGTAVQAEAASSNITSHIWKWWGHWMGGNTDSGPLQQSCRSGCVTELNVQRPSWAWITHVTPWPSRASACF